jgi:hypothetical protein
MSQLERNCGIYMSSGPPGSKFVRLTQKSGSGVEPGFESIDSDLPGGMAQDGFQGGVEIAPDLRHALIPILARDRVPCNGGLGHVVLPKCHT